MKTNRLIIAIPSGQEWSADFGMALVFMTNYLASKPEINGKVTQMRVHNKRGSILPNMRQKLVEQALEGGATHLLFLDSDQTFPADLVHRLMEHKKLVVAANIATKSFPANFTARKEGNVQVYTGPDSHGLERVWRVGTGVMLLDLRLFKRDGMQERPWFSPHWNEETQDYVGEDWAFCERLEAAGVPIYIDHDVSREIGHVGKFEYTYDLVEGLKDAEGF